MFCLFVCIFWLMTWLELLFSLLSFIVTWNYFSDKDRNEEFDDVSDKVQMTDVKQNRQRGKNFRKFNWILRGVKTFFSKLLRRICMILIWIWYQNNLYMRSDVRRSRKTQCMIECTIVGFKVEDSKKKMYDLFKCHIFDN